MKIAGFDIGGANTDVAIVDFDDSGNIKNIKTGFKYLPMWIKKDELEETLFDLLGSDTDKIDAVGISMTAELVDVYKTKKEGVLDITDKVKKTFDVPIGVVGVDGILNVNEVAQDPIKVAAANWMATAQISSKILRDCIMIDVGSTTTDIIPIKNGLECAKGRSDLERLRTGELVYTGVLRTNVATIVDKVPLDDGWVRVSSELFAITADIHLVLDNIKKDDYTCDTPDGEGKSKKDCMQRISRVVCGDLEILSPSDIEKISEYIYKKQIQQILEALLEVSKREEISKVVTTGLGMDILADKTCEAAGFVAVGMDKLLKKEECVVAPAVGTALLMEKFLKVV